MQNETLLPSPRGPSFPPPFGCVEYVSFAGQGGGFAFLSSALVPPPPRPQLAFGSLLLQARPSRTRKGNR